MKMLILPFGMALAMVAAQAQTQPNQNTQSQSQSQNGQAWNDHQNGTPNGEYTHARSVQNRDADTKTNSNMMSPKARISNEVGDLLNSTNEARVALESHNKQDAEFHIDHALQQANMIRSNAPDRHFVQLYDELDSYAVLAPIMTQRAAAQTAGRTVPNSQQSDASHIASSTANNSTANDNNHETANNNSTANNNATANNSSPDEAVRQVAGQFTSVALDVKGADEHLLAAKQALQAGNYLEADAALRAVQDEVVVTSVEADFPLLRARENLMLARESAQNGNFGEAHAALQGASRALARYAMSSSRHANDARMLKSQIDSYDQSIQQNHTGAVQKIEGWWDQTASWITPPNANASANANNGTRG